MALRRVFKDLSGAGKEKGSGIEDLPGARVPSWTCRRRSNVSRNLPEAGEYAPFRSGLFGPLWSLAWRDPGLFRIVFFNV